MEKTVTVVMTMDEYKAHEQAGADHEQAVYSVEELTQAAALLTDFIRKEGLADKLVAYLSTFPQPIEGKIISADTTHSLIDSIAL